MLSFEDIAETVESYLGAILLSAPKGLTPEELEDCYYNLTGYSIPFELLGFSSLRQFVSCSPHLIYARQTDNGDLRLFKVSEEVKGQYWEDERTVTQKKSHKSRSKSTTPQKHAPSEAARSDFREKVKKLLQSKNGPVAYSTFSNLYEMTYKKVFPARRLFQTEARTVFTNHLSDMVKVHQTGKEMFLSLHSSYAEQPCSGKNQRDEQASASSAQDCTHSLSPSSSAAGTETRNPDREQDVMRKAERDIRSILLSAPKGLTPEELERDFKGLTGGSIPYKAFGCFSLRHFVENSRHLMRVQQTRNGNLQLFKVSQDTTKHMEDLVAGQKASKKTSKLGSAIKQEETMPQLTSFAANSSALLTAQMIFKEKVRLLLQKENRPIRYSDFMTLYQRQYKEGLPASKLFEASYETVFKNHFSDMVKLHEVGDETFISLHSNTDQRLRSGKEQHNEQFDSYQGCSSSSPGKTGTFPLQQEQQPVPIRLIQPPIGRSKILEQMEDNTLLTPLKGVSSAPQCISQTFDLDSAACQRNVVSLTEKPSTDTQVVSTEIPEDMEGNSFKTPKDASSAPQQRVFQTSDPDTACHRNVVPITESPSSSTSTQVVSTNILKEMTDSSFKTLKDASFAPQCVLQISDPDTACQRNVVSMAERASAGTQVVSRVTSGKVNINLLTSVVQSNCIPNRQLKGARMSPLPEQSEKRGSASPTFGAWTVPGDFGTCRIECSKPVSWAPEISESVLDRISHYVDNHERGVFLEEIQRVFKDQLQREDGALNLFRFLLVDGVAPSTVDGTYRRFVFNNYEGRLVVRVVRTLDGAFMGLREAAALDCAVELRQQEWPVDVESLDQPQSEEERLVAVTVAQFNSPTDFYLQLHSSSSSLNSLMREMNQFYRSPKASAFHLPVTFIRVGLLCAAPYALTISGYYRAKVLQLPIDGKVLVNFVDFGSVARVSVMELLYLKRDYLRLPAQALHSTLYGVRNASTSRERVAQAFFDLCDTTDLHAYLFGVKEGVNQVSLVAFINGAARDVTQALIARELVVDCEYATARGIDAVDLPDTEENADFLTSESREESQVDPDLIDFNPSPGKVENIANSQAMGIHNVMSAVQDCVVNEARLVPRMVCDDMDGVTLEGDYVDWSSDESSCHPLESDDEPRSHFKVWSEDANSVNESTSTGSLGSGFHNTVIGPENAVLVNLNNESPNQQSEVTKHHLENETGGSGPDDKMGAELGTLFSSLASQERIKESLTETGAVGGVKSGESVVPNKTSERRTAPESVQYERRSLMGCPVFPSPQREQLESELEKVSGELKAKQRLLGGRKSGAELEKLIASICRLAKWKRALQKLLRTQSGIESVQDGDTA